MQLFDRRKRCVQGSEQPWWDQLSLEYMSFESSDDEESVIRVHSLPWRSKSKKMPPNLGRVHSVACYRAQ